MTEQRPEGRLLGHAAKASGRSIRSLAASAGMSDTRWRQIVKGSITARVGDEPAPVVAPALTLARMAHAVGLSPDDLVQVGRADAAEALERLAAKPVAEAEPEPALPVSVYLAVSPAAGLVYAGFSAPVAHEHARAVRGVVAALPAIADYRPLQPTTEQETT